MRNLSFRLDLDSALECSWVYLELILLYFSLCVIDDLVRALRDVRGMRTSPRSSESIIDFLEFPHFLNEIVDIKNHNHLSLGVTFFKELVLGKRRLILENVNLKALTMII